MKYNIFYITCYKGNYLQVKTNKEPLDYEKAKNYAMKMNEHMWKFHSDKEDETRIYTLKEAK